MLISGNLGFRVAVVLVIVVFPVVGLVLRRKWRLEVARREEISRLLGLAAEEAAQAENETPFSYNFADVPAPVTPVVYYPSHRVCAVCYTPTTNRCSRCKLVHYCSGKCQIVHWRHGHKDECQPLPASSEINDEANYFGGDALKQRYSDDYVTQVESGEQPENAVEGRRISNPAFSSPHLTEKDDGSLNEIYLGVDEPDSIFFSGQDACISDSSSDDDFLHNHNSESCDSSSTFGTFETASNDRQMEQTELLGKPYMKVDFDEGVYDSGGLKDDSLNGKTSSLGLIVNQSVENFVEPSISVSGFWDGALDTSTTSVFVNNYANPKPVGAGDEKYPESSSTVQFSSKLSSAPYSANKESAIRLQNSSFSSSKGPESPDTRVVGIDERHINSGVVFDNSKDDSFPSSFSRTNDLERNNDGTKQLPAFSSFGLKGHSELAEKFVKNGGNAAIPPQEVRSSSAAVNKRSSMLKVVEQLRATKSPKQGGYVARNAEKAVFAYDLFVKLYHWNKVEFRPCGLINYGNSCYANAVLQCLAFTPPLTAFLLQGLHSKACVKKEWCFTCEFERLVLKSKKLGCPQSAASILSQIKKIGSHLTNGREEDAHEFLRYAIEAMQYICLQEAKVKDSSTLEEETTLVGLTFGGFLRSKIKCGRCHVKSERQERMMDLTVEIEGDIETLEDALQHFTRTETLDGENKYHCERCKSYEKAKKKLNIIEAPNILTIALKRFQSGKFGKLNKSIRFPEILNLAPYMSGGSDKTPIYSLYGVVVHLDIMNASYTGHYVCYIRNAQNKWFKINDSSVDPVELDQVLNKGAYMLFYSRCSPRAPKSIRRTIISYDLSSNMKNPTVHASQTNGISTSRQIDNLGNHGCVRQDATKHPFLNDSSELESSSDGSVFSHSDKDSTSTDSDTSSSSSSSSFSPQYMRRSPLSNSKRYSSALSEQNLGSEGTFLDSNSSSQVSNLVNISGSEANARRIRWANPLDNAKSSVHLRRLSRRNAD